MPTKSSRAKSARKSQSRDLITREYEQHKALRIAGLIGTVLLVAWLVVALLEPTPGYKLSGIITAPVTSAQVLRDLNGLTAAPVAENTVVEPLYNGENYYEAELAAMRAAQHSIDLEAYIFKPSEIGRLVAEALAERAKAGIKVNVIVDAVGSPMTRRDFFHDVTAAGGQVHWYNPLRWNNWFRYNNRTHRELLIIDGKIGFLGGAGFADYWYKSTNSEPRWRDSMFRVEGDAVPALQATFVENWVEASNRVISGADYFPEPPHLQGNRALVVSGSPSMGGSTRTRLLFTELIAAAQQSIDISTPYFIPDSGLSEELAKASERGVQVRLMVPGDHTDHKVVRATSRSHYGDLLAAGAKVYEYRPAMLHQKLLIVDRAWVVVGSTNIDVRSFGLNDEVNLAILDSDLAVRITDQFEHDLKESKPVTLEQWKHRSPWERGMALIGHLWSRQQ